MQVVNTVSFSLIMIKSRTSTFVRCLVNTTDRREQELVEILRLPTLWESMSQEWIRLCPLPLATRIRVLLVYTLLQNL